MRRAMSEAVRRRIGGAWVRCSLGCGILAALLSVGCDGTTDADRYLCVSGTPDDIASYRGSCVPVVCRDECSVAATNRCLPDDCVGVCHAAHDHLSKECQIALFELWRCIVVGDFHEDAVCVPGRLPDFPLPGDACIEERRRHEALCPAVFPWASAGGADSGVSD